MLEKKALSFPPWVEATLAIILLIMGYIETIHDQWFWAAIFVVTGMGVGLALIARLRGGDNNGQE